jgi:hypothetical protein
VLFVVNRQRLGGAQARTENPSVSPRWALLLDAVTTRRPSGLKAALFTGPAREEGSGCGYHKKCYCDPAESRSPPKAGNGGSCAGLVPAGKFRRTPSKGWLAWRWQAEHVTDYDLNSFGDIEPELGDICDALGRSSSSFPLNR